MGNGWVKNHRSAREWEWYKVKYMVRFFNHLILSANHEDRQWRGITIKRGQLVTGRKQLSKDTGIPEQSIRTCINRLKSTNEITTKPTNKFTIITIVNYEKYQNPEEGSNQQINQQANHQSTSNQPQTRIKELKNIKNYRCNSDELRLSQLLQSLILERQPTNKCRSANLQGWAKHIDLAIRIDGRTPDEIERVLRWSQKNSFWQANILSTKKLREKFDTLQGQMGASGTNQPTIGSEYK